MGNNISKPARTSPPVRVSYTQSLFTAKAFQQGQDPKYSVTIMIDKTNAEQMAFMKAIHADAQAALAEAWPDQAKRPRIALVGETKSLIKDGDKTLGNDGVPLVEKNPEYAGHYLIRVSSKQKPVVVDRNRQEILDPAVVYGGCVCKVNINVYTFDTQANKGVTAGINGVQFWADGERLGGGRPALESMFDAAGPAPVNDPFAGVTTDVGDGF